MTREKMKEIQGIRPRKRFFTLNRKGLKDRATETLVNMAAEGKCDPLTVGKGAHAHFAPLTNDEMKEVRTEGAAIWKEFQEKRAAEEKVA